jgi:CelD/BcsL family acetyltransferase involved in cellulose biosynthesis
MLEESHRLGHTQFDFSIGGEEYKWVYATHARLLGPLGRPPLKTRVLAAAKQQAKRALAVAPLALEIVVALRKHI